MVFDATAAPRSRTKFLAWYKKQSEWQESHGYNYPNIPSPVLKNWFQEIIKSYPPMNGPLASDDPDNSKVTAYSLGRSVIYGSFAWSEADPAYKRVKDVATSAESASLTSVALRVTFGGRWQDGSSHAKQGARSRCRSILDLANS